MRKRFSRGVSRYIDSVSLKMKIILIFFIFIIVPLSIFTVIAYNRISSLVFSQTLNSASQSLEESKSTLEKYFKNMDKAMYNLVFDNMLRGIAVKSTAGYSIQEQLDDFDAIIKQFNYLKNGIDVDNIRYYIFNESFLAENNRNILNEAALVNELWYGKLQKSNLYRIWHPSSYMDSITGVVQPCFSYAGIVFDNIAIDKPVGVFTVDLNAVKIHEILSDAAITENSNVFLYNGKEILYSNAENTLSLHEAILPENPERFVSAEWKPFEANGHKYLVKAHILKPTSLYAISAVSVSDISILQDNMRKELFFVLLLLATISYMLALFISNSSLKRILILNMEMKKIEGGSLEVTFKPSGRDEIGELMESFKRMAKRMFGMMEEQYKLGQKMKSAELNALQAQINPHFLYNSLDLVNCLAIKHNVPDITDMVTALAMFYRLSLSKGNDIISLRDELTHAQLYVSIQNMRFDNNIAFVPEIQEELYEYSTLKTVLQPIVENSIMHGIFEKESCAGTIRISGTLENGTVVLKIADDGVGIPEDILRTILLEDKSSRRHGYGVKNTDERLRLYFGREYGLNYASVLGQGTTVTVRFPAVRYSG